MRAVKRMRIPLDCGKGLLLAVYRSFYFAAVGNLVLFQVCQLERVKTLTLQYKGGLLRQDCVKCVQRS